MKIFIITLDEPIYTIPGIEKIAGVFKIEGIAVVPVKPKNKSLFKFLSQNMFCFGLKYTIYTGFKMALYKFLNLIDLAFGLSRPYSAKGIAKRHKIPFYYIENVNDNNFIKMIKEKEIDIILSFCGQIYKSDMISTPKIGIINKHCALLPKYRGVYPIFWAILNDEEYVGTTIHFINGGIDTGGLLRQEKVKVEKEDTFVSLYEKTHKIFPDMIISVLNDIKNNSLHVKEIKTKQDESYYSYPSKNDIKEFFKKGKRIC